MIYGSGFFFSLPEYKRLGKATGSLHYLIKQIQSIRSSKPKGDSGILLYIAFDGIRISGK